MRRGEILLREAKGLLDRLTGSEAHRHGLVASAMAAHGLEDAFHRAVVGQMSRPVETESGDGREAFTVAVEAMERASLKMRGVFGSHWMLPWLQRCREVGHEAHP